MIGVPQGDRKLKTYSGELCLNNRGKKYLLENTKLVEDMEPDQCIIDVTQELLQPVGGDIFLLIASLLLAALMSCRGYQQTSTKHPRYLGSSLCGGELSPTPPLPPLVPCISTPLPYPHTLPLGAQNSINTSFFQTTE